MSRAALLAALLSLTALAPISAAPADPQKDVEGSLMCYCGCANLTIRDCSCGTAAQIKSDIAQRLAAGQTPDQVIAAYVSQHGEKIRSAPERRGFNLMAWVMPFAAIFAGAIMIVALTRRWKRRATAAAAGPDGGAAVPAPPPDAADGEALKRVEREMRETL